DDVLDRLILDLGELLGVHRLVFVMRLSRLPYRLRPEKTADDIRAIGWFLDSHDSPPRCADCWRKEGTKTSRVPVMRRTPKVVRRRDHSRDLPTGVIPAKAGIHLSSRAGG